MAKTTTLLPLLLLLLILVVNVSLIEAVYHEQEASSYHLKRSLCNTFGGCSSSTTKRSLKQQPRSSTDSINLVNQLRQQVEGGNAIESANNNDSSFYAKRIEEILADLFEYMQNNEKYRQGKYVIVVPKRLPEQGKDEGSLLSLITTNNRISPYMDAGSTDLQELQILKRED